MGWKSMAVTKSVCLEFFGFFFVVVGGGVGGGGVDQVKRREEFCW
jgi:hypothetical protein